MKLNRGDTKGPRNAVAATATERTDINSSAAGPVWLSNVQAGQGFCLVQLAAQCAAARVAAAHLAISRATRPGEPKVLGRHADWAWPTDGLEQYFDHRQPT